MNYDIEIRKNEKENSDEVTVLSLEEMKMVLANMKPNQMICVTLLEEQEDDE